MSRNIEIKSSDIFITRIWESKLSFLETHFQSWRDRIDQMRLLEAKERGASNRCGWNTNIRNEDQHFSPLFEVCGQTLLRILECMTDKRSEHKLTAWANMHDKGGFNVQHNHPSAILSACFYLSVPVGSGDLVFIDPRPGVNLSTLNGYGPNCRSVFRIKPEEGLLVVFPSWLEHLVEPHENTEPRLSIAMNLS